MAKPNIMVKYDQSNLLTFDGYFLDSTKHA